MGVTISMNKSELAELVGNDCGMSKGDAMKAVDSVIDNITKALKGGHSVTFVGFGTFDVRDRAARTGRNPRTGEALEIAAAKNPAFKAGKALKDAVN